MSKSSFYADYVSNSTVPPLQPKDCPFCGKRAEIRSKGLNNHYIACVGCDSASPMLFSAKEDAVPVLLEIWNTRVSDDTLARKRYSLFHDETNKPTLVEDENGPPCLFNDAEA